MCGGKYIFTTLRFFLFHRSIIIIIAEQTAPSAGWLRKKNQRNTKRKGIITITSYMHTLISAYNYFIRKMISVFSQLI